MEEHPRRKHHTVPRHYLKGFTSELDPVSVWIFTKGKKYNLGKQHHDKFSPCLTSTRIADTELDFYANEVEGDLADFDSTEKKLEQAEKPCQPIIDKIRDRQDITDAEKRILADYIILMYIRVRHFRSDPNKVYEKTKHEIFDRFFCDVQDAMLFYRNDPEQIEQIKLFETELQRIKGRYENEKELMLRKIFNGLLFESFEIMTNALFNMNWTFALSISQSPFITSDNPVYFSRAGGLSRSDLSFPISKHIALVASPRPLFNKQYENAPEEIVRQINKRTICLATKYVFSPISARWIMTITNRGEDYIKLGI